MTSRGITISVTGLAFIGLAFALGSCGSDYCIAGFGPCRFEGAGTSTDSGKPSMTSSSPTAVALGSATFAASGGTPTYTFTVPSGCGTINGSGAFTGGSLAGCCVVRVADAAGKFTELPILILSSTSPGGASPPAIASSVLTVVASGSASFTATNGTSPYTFTVATGLGSFVDSSVGTFTAPSTTGCVVVRVTDSVSQFAERPILVVAQ